LWERVRVRVASSPTTLTPALSRQRERESVKSHLPLAGDGYSSPLSHLWERVRVRVASSPTTLTPALSRQRERE